MTDTCARSKLSLISRNHPNCSRCEVSGSKTSSGQIRSMKPLPTLCAFPAKNIFKCQNVFSAKCKCFDSYWDCFLSQKWSVSAYFFVNDSTEYFLMWIMTDHTFLFCCIKTKSNDLPSYNLSIYQSYMNFYSNIIWRYILSHGFDNNTQDIWISNDFW